MAKRGRKATHYVTSDGETIVGLTLRKKRGRQVFMPVGQDAPTFGNAEDEALAIHKFRVWQGRQRGELEPLDNPIDWGLNDASRRYWRDYYRNLILTNPRQAALEMDCEPLALLVHVEDLKPPAPSVTLTECLALYQARRKGISAEESKKVRNAWKLFRNSVAPATTLEQVTTGDGSLFERWVDAVWLPFEDEGSPKTLRHKVDRVKRVIRYCHDKKQQDKGNCKRLLDELTALELPDPNKENPNPLSVEEFHRLLKAAKGSFWEPMLLVMLNLCYLCLRNIPSSLLHNDLRVSRLAGRSAMMLPHRTQTEA